MTPEYPWLTDLLEELEKHTSTKHLEVLVERARHDNIDFDRLQWSLAHLRCLKTLTYFNNDKYPDCVTAITTVAGLCTMQAYTDVAPETWELARKAAWVAARAAARAAAWAARAAATWAAQVAAEAAAWAAAWAARWVAARAAAGAAEAARAAAGAAEAARAEHWQWEVETLTNLISEKLK